MQRYLFLVPALMLVSAPSFAQKKPVIQEFKSDAPTEEGEKVSRRRAAGFQDLGSFGAQKEPPPKPFPWLAIGLGFLIVLGLAPVGFKMYKSTRKDLEDQSTFGMTKARQEMKDAQGAAPAGLSRRPPARALKDKNKQEAGGETRMLSTEDVPGNTPRDVVWDTVSGANGNWVTADWVATNAGLPASEASDELAALVQEGYLQEARDRAGKPVFRAAS